MISQKLRGLVGQGMNGARKSVTPAVYSYPAGSYTFTVPKNGWYRFVVWGAGGGGVGAGNPGGSGAFIIAERPLTKGQQIALVVGRGGDASFDGNASTVTFPTGELLTAGPGIGGVSGGTGGTATGGSLDRLINGSAKEVDGGGNNGGTSGSGLGAGSPGWDSYRGGNGGGLTSSEVLAQRGAGGYTSSSADNTKGGDGEILIHQIRLRP